jgi:hypothetical protein
VAAGVAVSVLANAAAGVVSALCITSGGTTTVVPAERFTLAWEHSVEKVLWEEDYRIAGGWIYMTGARIRGSGAGMEPPDGAVLFRGAWHFRGEVRWFREILLAGSEFGGEYRLRVDDGPGFEQGRLALRGRSRFEACRQAN